MVMIALIAGLLASAQASPQATPPDASKRFPPEQERLIMAIDLDGFSSGRCWKFLSVGEQDEIEAGQARFDARPVGSPGPILDQVFYGAVGRGVLDASRSSPDPELCAALREKAVEGVMRQAEAIRNFEDGLPPELRRRPSAAR